MQYFNRDFLHYCKSRLTFAASKSKGTEMLLIDKKTVVLLLDVGFRSAKTVLNFCKVFADALLNLRSTSAYPLQK